MATTITKETLQPQQGTSSSSMAEDESSKRNTDCVYFLASPLTCKKGNECEYRHSEYARINPRDCWYWMNGNCLNPKCSFRHPPLDGLVSPQSGNFAGPPALVQPGPPVPASPQNPTKQGVPCIFFQKGYCLKGDRCPFMHGPNPPSAKMQLVPASIAASEAPAFKKNFGTLEKCTQPKMNSNVNTPKVVKAPPQPKVIPPKGQSSRPVNGEPSGRGYQPPRVVIEEAPKYEEMKPSSVDNGRSRSGRALHGGSYDDQSFQNGRDADDSLRESSPGFDVLVDDKLSEDEYYHNDQYSRIRGHDRRNPKEFDLGHQDDRNPAADVDSEIYHNRRGYDPFDRVPDKYGWDHRRASSERSLGEPAHYDRRGPYKSESPDLNQNSDLRHRLSKQRRVNGLKSVVNSDYGFDDHHSEDRGYRSAQRDSRRSPIHETSRGNRLHGRIKLPRRTSPMNGNDMHPDRETERGRNWGRSSPSRQQVSGQQGRLRDRLSGRILDESREGRRINGPMASIAGADFAAPKRLSELRGSQQSDSKQQQLKSQQSVAGGKLRDTVLASSIATEGDLSFEGPKPLSEILKRKRSAPTGINTDDKEEIKLNENNVYSAANSGKHVTLTSAIVQDEVGEVYSKPPTIEADEEEGEILNKKTKLDGEGEYTLPEPDDHKHPEAEEGLAAVDGEEPEYDEEYDHGEDGDYDYEQVDGEGFNLNEGETGDHEVDSMDEDDGDDFAKKLGVSF